MLVAYFFVIQNQPSHFRDAGIAIAGGFIGNAAGHLHILKTFSYLSLTASHASCTFGALAQAPRPAHFYACFNIFHIFRFSVFKKNLFIYLS